MIKRTKKCMKLRPCACVCLWVGLRVFVCVPVNVCVSVCARGVLLSESTRRIKSKYGVNIIFLFLQHVQHSEIIVTKKKRRNCFKTYLWVDEYGAQKIDKLLLSFTFPWMWEFFYTMVIFIFQTKKRNSPIWIALSYLKKNTCLIW